jgi:hypothetical protein
MKFFPQSVAGWLSIGIVAFAIHGLWVNKSWTEDEKIAKITRRLSPHCEGMATVISEAKRVQIGEQNVRTVIVTLDDDPKIKENKQKRNKDHQK